MRLVAEGAAKLMAADDGPRVAALAFDGWDTHANEGGATGRLAQLLGGLDGAFDALREGARRALEGYRRSWPSPSSAAPPASTAPAAPTTAPARSRFWPAARSRAGGSSPIGRACATSSSTSGRDLKPTTDLRAVLKGVLAEQFDLSAAVLGDAVFPQTAGLKPMMGLIA